MRHFIGVLLASAVFVGAPSTLSAAPSVLVAGAPAAADDPPRPSSRPTRYYGWQNIIVGYTGLGLLAHGWFSESKALMLTGAATWTFGGSVVHAIHGNPGAAAATPFITGIGSTALIALAVSSSSSSRDAEIPVLLGVLYALASPIIDGALGRDDDPERDVPVFVRAGLGVARFRTRYPAAGDGVLGASQQFGTALELSIGGRVRNVVIAATLLEHIVTYDDRWHATTPLAGTMSLTHVTLGPTVEWHRDRRGGTFIGGTLGLAHFANRTDHPPKGFSLAGHVGYDFVVGPRSAIGLALRVLYSSMSDAGDNHAQAFSPSVNLSYAYR